MPIVPGIIVRNVMTSKNVLYSYEMHFYFSLNQNLVRRTYMSVTVGSINCLHVSVSQINKIVQDPLSFIRLLLLKFHLV